MSQFRLCVAVRVLMLFWNFAPFEFGTQLLQFLFSLFLVFIGFLEVLAQQEVSPHISPKKF